MAGFLAPYCTDQALLQLIDNTLAQIQDWTAITVDRQEQPPSTANRYDAWKSDQIADRYITSYDKLVAEQQARKLPFTARQLDGPERTTAPTRYMPRHQT